MKTLFAVLAMVLSSTTLAQVREDYYGGWIAEIDGDSHIFHIVLRDNNVSGIFCHDCEHLSNLAFIDDGRFDANGLAFMLYHAPAGEPEYREQITAVRKGEALEVVRQREGSSARMTMLMHRQTPDDALDSLPVNPGPPGNRERILPGEPEPVSPDKVVGTWLWGAGPGKQIFMFRRHKNGLRGLVCGPCNRLDAVAPLEQISWQGTNFHFEIVHEDNGLDFKEQGSHSNITNAIISHHEMHMNVIQSFKPRDSAPIKMTLVGPIRNY